MTGGTVQALVIESPGRAALCEILFTPIAGECVVRVLRAGICGTDLQLLEGYAGFAGIPGHEFVGVVHSVATDDDAHWLGLRVVAEINVGCGACAECRAGIKEHCATRSVLGIRGRPGSFAERVSVPAANLHAVPSSISDDAAVFVEPTAAACRVLEQVALADRRVAVLGDGRMGLVVAQVLRTATADVTVFGRHEAKLAVARSLGLAAEPVARATCSPRFDVVVDVTGRPGGLQHAIDLARPRGTVVMKTTTHGAAPFTSWPAVVNEVTLVGSRCGPFAPAIALLARGAVRVEPLISAVFSQHASSSVPGAATPIRFRRLRMPRTRRRTQTAIARSCGLQRGRMGSSDVRTPANRYITSTSPQDDGSAQPSRAVENESTEGGTEG